MFFSPRFVLILMASTWMGCSSFVDSTADDEFNPRVVIKRRFPTIKNVEIQDFKKANQFLKDEELVLGVVVNGKPRAYAINILTGPTREIINDDLGGTAIAATW